MASPVSLVRTSDLEDVVRNSLGHAIDLINFRPRSRARSIVIKPNLCYYWKADTGYTTDPQLVAAIIDWIRKECGSNVQIRVVEADATAMRTKHAFLMLGYEELAKEKNVELFNLSNDTLEERKISVNNREIVFQVPQSLLSADLFINVPKFKTMRATRITCALKNVFGCVGVPRKIVYHAFLDEAIVGINKILHPDLTVVDGIVALGRFPIKLGLIMAGTDPFSIDWVASEIMGFNPSKIGALRIAMEEEIVNSDSPSIVGDSSESFKQIFPRSTRFSSNLWNLQLRFLRIYQKITGDVIPPILEDMRA